MPAPLAFVNSGFKGCCILYRMPLPEKSNSSTVLDSFHESMGQKITRHRKALGMTQLSLAEKLDINRTMITEYESGRVRIYDEMLAKLAGALNTTVDDLLCLDAGPTGNLTVDLKIMKRLKKIESLPPFEQKTLLKTIDTYIKGAGVGASD